MPFEGFENHELVDLKALRAARLACHWAAQLPAAVGNTPSRNGRTRPTPPCGGTRSSAR